jgi:hypothetical protein
VRNKRTHESLIAKRLWNETFEKCRLRLEDYIKMDPRNIDCDDIMVIKFAAEL